MSNEHLSSPQNRNNITVDSSTSNSGAAGGETTIGVAGTQVSALIFLDDRTRIVYTGASQITSDETGIEKWIHLKFTWAGKTFDLDIAESDRVFDLKALLQSLTDVPPERQKILGLVKGKLPPEQERV